MRRSLKRNVVLGLVALCGVALCHFFINLSLPPAEVLSDPQSKEVQIQQKHEKVAFDTKESSAEEMFDAVRGHLAVIRKELEFVKSTSNLSQEARDQMLYNKLKEDDDFMKSDNLDRLLQLASLFHEDNKKDTPKSGGRPPKSRPLLEINADDNFESGDTFQTKRKPPPESKNDNYIVNITLKERDVEDLRKALALSLQSHTHRRRSSRPPLNIYANGKSAWELFHNRIKQHELYAENDRVQRYHGFGCQILNGKSAWELFHNRIKQHELYAENDRAIDQLLFDLGYKSIVGLKEISDLGTQLKLVLKLNYGGQALFKPMRISKDAEANPNHYMYEDFERHHAEIAAFHLDRVLNFRRVPPVAGRYVNLTSQIKRYASKKLSKTFFTSPAKNVCFYGSCDAYCDSGHAVCGHPHVVEGSMSAWLPDDRYIKRKHWANPWAQSYSSRHKAEWEYNENYCEKVKRNQVYMGGRRLLDVMDMGIFDYLAGNKDRHHYHTMEVFGNYTFILLFDNGRGFGRYRHDEVGLISPVRQCCMIRASTLKRLISLQLGPRKLSSFMRESLSDDNLSPVLNDQHLAALDRRVAHILQIVHECVKKKGRGDVIIDDGF